jgi:hypothetical protein
MTSCSTWELKFPNNKIISIFRKTPKYFDVTSMHTSTKEAVRGECKKPSHVPVLVPDSFFSTSLPEMHIEYMIATFNKILQHDFADMKPSDKM